MYSCYKSGNFDLEVCDDWLIVGVSLVWPLEKLQLAFDPLALVSYVSPVGAIFTILFTTKPGAYITHNSA